MKLSFYWQFHLALLKRMPYFANSIQTKVSVASKDSGLKPEYTHGNGSHKECLLCLALLFVM